MMTAELQGHLAWLTVSFFSHSFSLINMSKPESLSSCITEVFYLNFAVRVKLFFLQSDGTGKRACIWEAEKIFLSD